MSKSRDCTHENYKRSSESTIFNFDLCIMETFIASWVTLMHVSDNTKSVSVMDRYLSPRYPKGTIYMKPRDLKRESNAKLTMCLESMHIHIYSDFVRFNAREKIFNKII